MLEFSLRRAAWALTFAALGAGLGGCVEEMAAVGGGTPAPVSARIAARPGVSPRGAPLAFASLEGAPDAIVARFSQETAAAAASRDVASAEPAAAAYLARGYLAAYAVEGGTAFASVWDLYDKSRRRVQRLEDFVIVKGAAADPWSLADDRLLAGLAARSADSIAATLTNTPEAIAAAARGPVVAMDPAPASPAAAPPFASGFR